MGYGGLVTRRHCRYRVPLVIYWEIADLTESSFQFKLLSWSAFLMSRDLGESRIMVFYGRTIFEDNIKIPISRGY